MQTEKAKSSHFDRTRGLKNQIFPTLNWFMGHFGQSTLHSTLDFYPEQPGRNQIY